MKKKPFSKVRVYKTKAANLHDWQTDAMPEKAVKPNPETARTLCKAYEVLMGKVVHATKKKDGTYRYSYTYYNGKPVRRKRRPK